MRNTSALPQAPMVCTRAFKNHALGRRAQMERALNYHVTHDSFPSRMGTLSVAANIPKRMCRYR